jgi:hypothetical protein
VLENPQGQICAERSRLLDLYGEAVKRLTATGEAVSAAAISYEADFFNRAWSISQDAWRECVRCRNELHQHMAEHGCCE